MIKESGIYKQSIIVADNVLTLSGYISLKCFALDLLSQARRIG